MDKEVKEKWLNALRSGKFYKGKGKLCSHNKYCCLGILCEISFDKIKKITPETYSDINQIGFHRSFLPPSFAKEIDINVEHESNLVNINDRTEDFSEVIKYIEENL